MNPVEYRPKEESYRLAERICDLLMAYPRRKASRLLLEVLEDGDGDGRVMRKLNKKVPE